MYYVLNTIIHICILYISIPKKAFICIFRSLEWENILMAFLPFFLLANYWGRKKYVDLHPCLNVSISTTTASSLMPVIVIDSIHIQYYISRLPKTRISMSKLLIFLFYRQFLKFAGEAVRILRRFV